MSQVAWVGAKKGKSERASAISQQAINSIMSHDKKSYHKKSIVEDQSAGASDS
jgi:hypothetical protein